MSKSLSRDSRSILVGVGTGLRACPRRPSSSPLLNTLSLSLRHDERRLDWRTRRLFATAPTPFQSNASSASVSAEDTATTAQTDVKIRAPQGAISIVFTDIVKSTAIWESNASAMTSALQLHDSIIRTLTTTHQGYEVKQNGDGFLLAFPSAVSAIQFCLDVQQQLLDQEWPEELLALQPGREASDDEGHVLFRGLRLRMSAHWGEPVCAWNEVIQRMDYLGPIVNRAARFIQVTEGGQIVVSEEFLLELQKAKRGQGVGPLFDLPVQSAEDAASLQLDLKDLECEAEQQKYVDRQFEVRLLGERHFKGLTEMEKLYFIIPQSLRGRLNYWPKHKHIPGSKGNIIAS